MLCQWNLEDDKTSMWVLQAWDMVLQHCESLQPGTGCCIRSCTSATADVYRQHGHLGGGTMRNTCSASVQSQGVSHPCVYLEVAA